MANYCCATRTNYFHVRDAERFREFMSNVVAAEDSVHLWEDVDSTGESVFGFGCYSSILGIEYETIDFDGDGITDYSTELFLEGLSEHVAPGDAIIIMESGNEKLRYVTGYATIVTETGTEFIDLTVEAAAKAAWLLGNDAWRTKMEY